MIFNIFKREQLNQEKSIQHLWLKWAGVATFLVCPLGVYGAISTSNPNTVLCTYDNQNGKTVWLGSWDVNNGNNDGSGKGLFIKRASFCLNEVDSVCGLSVRTPNNVQMGGVIYGKETDDGTFFKCKVNLGSDLIPTSHTPTIKSPVTKTKTSTNKGIDFSFAKGDGQCPTGTSIATYKEAKTHEAAACKVLSKWAIARIEGMGSMDGSGYKCKIRTQDTRKLGNTLCKTTKTAFAVNTDVTYDGGVFAPVENGAWKETKKGGKLNGTVFSFKEFTRDEWSIYLYDKSRDLTIQLDFWTKKISWNSGKRAVNAPERKILYPIVSPTLR